MANKFEKYGATLKGVDLSADGELDLINAQTLTPLKAAAVYAFRVVACDTKVDRDFEHFSRSALDEMAKRYVGQPILLDHNWSAANQTARIYAAEVQEMEGFARLVLRAYIPRTEETLPKIQAIESGILKEVSVGCSVASATCSICGEDKARHFCDHVPGQSYDGQLCTVELSDVVDTYEVSFVAVPAQPGAGTIKDYGGAKDPTEPPAPKPCERAEDVQTALALLELL